jgi:hypothetical protein
MQKHRLRLQNSASASGCASPSWLLLRSNQPTVGPEQRAQVYRRAKEPKLDYNKLFILIDTTCEPHHAHEADQRLNEILNEILNERLNEILQLIEAPHTLWVIGWHPNTPSSSVTCQDPQGSLNLRPARS